PLAAQCGFHLLPQSDKQNEGCGRRQLLPCGAIGGDGLRFGWRVHQEYKIAGCGYRVECYRKIDCARRWHLQLGELGILSETHHAADYAGERRYTASGWIGCSGGASHILPNGTLVREQVRCR